MSRKFSQLMLVLLCSLVLITLSSCRLLLSPRTEFVVYLRSSIHDQSETIPDVADPTKQVINPDYQKVYHEIKALLDVESLRFLSKKELLASLTKSAPEVWEHYKDDDKNPLHDAYIVKIKASAKVKETYGRIEQIQAVERIIVGQRSK